MDFSYSLLFPLLLLALVIGPSSAISLHPDGKTVFSLIHRDSDASPFKRNWTSVTERFRENREAGRIRSRYIHQRITKVQAKNSNDYINLNNGLEKFGAYYLEVYVSDSFQKQWLIYETASELVWFQCKGCNPCFSQPHRAFDISKSTSASIASCSSCKNRVYQNLQPNCTQNRCSYGYYYADGGSLSGFLAKETFSFAGGNRYKGIIFGCATSSKNINNFPDGIAGFGLGQTSLPNQLAPYLGRNAFSSCLVRYDLNVTNTLIMGPKAVAPSGILYTPLVNPNGNGSSPLYYNVQISKVLMGGTALSIPSSAFNAGSGTVIDAGTTFIYLRKVAADPILNQVRRFAKKLSVVSSTYFLLCYALKIKSVTDLNTYFPPITFVFKGNVNVTLLGYHYMIPYSNDTVCTAIEYAFYDEINILGTVFQQNFLVVHDLDKNRVGFKPVNCATGKAR